MTNTPPLALRPGQADWETEMWARAIVALIFDGEPPPVPLLIPTNCPAITTGRRPVARLTAAVPAS